MAIARQGQAPPHGRRGRLLSSALSAWKTWRAFAVAAGTVEAFWQSTCPASKRIGAVCTAVLDLGHKICARLAGFWCFTGHGWHLPMKWKIGPVMAKLIALGASMCIVHCQGAPQKGVRFGWRRLSVLVHRQVPPFGGSRISQLSTDGKPPRWGDSPNPPSYTHGKSSFIRK